MKRFLAPSLVFALIVASRTEAAELTGRFVYGGPTPTPAKLNIDKDAGVFGNLGLVDETLTVGPDGGIANVVVYLVTEGVPVPPDIEAAVPPKVEYDNRGGRFEPRVLTLWVGKQTLVLKNSDPVAHNSNLQPIGDVPINPLITPNDKVEYQFSKSQRLPQGVGCTIHPWMKGHILPRDNPFAAVSDKTGKFVIKGLPTGTPLEFQVWHEKSGYLLAKPDWKYEEDGRERIGRYKVTLSGDLDLGDIKVDPALFNK